jgi:hypothetical protein
VERSDLANHPHDTASGGTQRLLLVDPQIAQPAKQLHDYLNLRPESAFSRVQREMVATVVNGMVGAKPCRSAHCEALRGLTADHNLGPEFVERWPAYPMDAQTLAPLRHARKLTGGSTVSPTMMSTGVAKVYPTNQQPAAIQRRRSITSPISITPATRSG